MRNEAAHVASQAAHQASQKAADAVAGVQEGAREASRRAAQAANSAADRMRRQGATALMDQKDHAADELSHFSAAIRRAAETLHEEHDDRLASYADIAAERIEDASHYLRDADLGRLIDDVEHFARRRPELVFGGLFLAGLALSRFLKASSRHDEFMDDMDEPALMDETGFMEDDEFIETPARAGAPHPISY
jgi:hypothetical protein